MVQTFRARAGRIAQRQPGPRVASGTEWNESEFRSVLERLKADGAIDATGRRVSRERLERILTAAPEDHEHRGRRFLRDASFDGSTFEGHARFDGVVFERDAMFKGARFEVAPSFRAASFRREANFSGAHFGTPWDSESTPPESKPACFDGATFEGRATFEDARFHSRAEFGGKRGATFGEWAYFERTVFKEDAMFNGATFESRAMFGGAQVQGELARFDGATFTQARTFGPLRVRGALILDRARFGGPVRIETAAAIVSGVRTHFSSRATIVIRWADVQLDEAHFDAPVLVVGASAPFRDAEGAPLAEDGVAATGCAKCAGATGRPRVVSLRWANVGCLALSYVDLRACRFLGAHGLDGIRLEHDVEFARTPPRGGRLRGTWSRRQTLAEEHEWRARQERPGRGSARADSGAPTGWFLAECHPPDWLRENGGVEYDSRSLRRVPIDGTPPITPEAVAPLYRALRKSREDTKDEPGAADFYYGEMEMRRLAGRRNDRPHREEAGAAGLAYVQRSSSALERAVLWLYWAVSGYGLRASRALVCLLVTIAIFGVAFWGIGIECPAPPKGESAAAQPCQETIERGLLLSAESSSSLFRAPDANRYVLGDVGEVLQLAIRLLGPLFFGLGLLALRGRVKR